MPFPAYEESVIFDKNLLAKGLMKAEEVQNLLEKQFPDSMIQVSDLTGEGKNFDIRISSAAFNNKSMMDQHKMVYQALGDAMKTEIHAVKINTLAEV